MNENQLDVLGKRIASFPGETWEQVVDRVTNKILEDEIKENRHYYKKQYTWLLENMIFLPNSPCLRNFGANEGSGSACFVLPVEDNRDSIFNTLRDAVNVQAFGGGTGFNFSDLRPEGAEIASTKGKSSGPISFMEIYDYTLGSVIKQGGVRQGASMGVLNCDHPDIFKFLDAKTEEGKLSNFNISVGITDEFMKAVREGKDWKLIHNNKVYEVIKAQRLFNKIVDGIWNNGEPGIIFLDEVNKGNVFNIFNYYLEDKIVATNPCGEQPLPPYTSCVLGSINLVKLAELPRRKQEHAICMAVRFLDSIINVNNYPIPIIEEKTKRYRNIGLGVMGFADYCIDNRVIYGSTESRELASNIMNFIQSTSMLYSTDLGLEKGGSPIFKRDNWRRNYCTTSIAPTGTLSLLAGVTPGIEPIFSESFNKIAMDKIITVKHPKANSEFFITANEITPRDHIGIQAVFQNFVDAGISKTINLPYETTKERIQLAIFEAHKMKCKGLTMYRDGSRITQAQTQICPECGNNLSIGEGCSTCFSCGWSKCSLENRKG